jgi:hypothetical protein
MADFNETTKNLQKQAKDKFDEGKKKVGEGLDQAKEKAKEIGEKAKEKLTPETIMQIKAIIKQVKELISNLPLDKVPGLEKWLEKLDKLVEKLDPPDRASAKSHARALRALIDDELVPFIEQNVAVAKQDLDAYLHRALLTYDLLLMVEIELDRIRVRRKRR